MPVCNHWGSAELPDGVDNNASTFFDPAKLTPSVRLWVYLFLYPPYFVFPLFVPKFSSGTPGL